MYKIHNFQPFVPYGAQYLRVIKEHGDTYSVDYWRDEEGRNPVITYGLSGLILTGQEISEMTDGDFDVSDSQNRDYGTNYVVIEVDPKRDYMEVGEPFRIVEVEHEYRVGDIFRTVANDATQRVLVWVKVLKVLNDSEVDYVNPHVREASEPMKKLKDTTKVAGQNKQKLRDGDKGGKGKENDPDSSGEDVRGAGRYPHSKGEKEFADKHKVDIVDHPANQKDWGIETVSNKDIGNKFEDFAPLSSENFFLNEENSASLESLDRYIKKQYEKQIERIAKHNIDYNPYKKKSDEIAHLKELYPLSRYEDHHEIEYIMYGSMGYDVGLRNWLKNISPEEKLKDGTHGKTNQHLYDIVKHVRSSGYNSVSAGSSFKTFSHDFAEKLERGQAASVRFTLIVNGGQFNKSGDYSVRITISSNAAEEDI